ncbi:hypothetical protein [Pseudoxanthomonas suwonensis]|uniref:CopL family metal-binding regulatory protein n=1 Tax=Pseudoxanthomonas suwonensis TaxID=314722 RepID=A0A0E3Z1Y7_9GAMM|nr:hypothetical protein [Pseudoxanthomonas suwonensis]AKC86877.1 hypothetical protein WQ53_09040 [Pseudoxanthomonas suwonensis]
MTLLRRLSLCLLALALLPGAPVQARLAMAASTAPQAAPAGALADAQTGGCHGAEVAPASEAARTHHRDTAPGAGHPADCCGDTTAGHGCETACPCPSSITALPPAPQALPAAAHDRRWNTAGHIGRAGPADGPPKRPPIG